MQRAFVPWGSKGVLPPLPPPVQRVEAAQDALPEGCEPLQLWPTAEGVGEGAAPILVDNMLCRWLRPHQREGVQFLFDCVTDARQFGGCGCILADDSALCPRRALVSPRLTPAARSGPG